MAMPDAYRAITLAEFNVGAAAAVGLLNPLAAQIDALIALGIGPFQASLATQFNTALATQASLSLSINLGPAALLETLKATLAAAASLSAAISLSLSLNLPLPSLTFNAQLGVAASLGAALQVQLGGLGLLIKAALAVKIPALQTALGLQAALGAGPFFAIGFSGVPLAAVSTWLASEVASGGLDADGHHLFPLDPTYGVLIFGRNPSFQAAFNAIIAVPP